MALPKKGSRTITVDGVTYRWMVGKRSYTDAHGVSALSLSVVIEHAEQPGAMCRALFRGEALFAVPSLGFDDAQSISIKPGIVRQIIEHAHNKGWDPLAPSGEHLIKEGEARFTSSIVELPQNTSFSPEKHLQGLEVIYKREPDES